MPAPDIDALIEEGLTKYGSGDLDGAMLVWEHVLSLDPDNEQAHSYVDYVRQNYDLLVDGGAALSGEDASPFGIEDDEYSVEIIEGGPLVQVPATMSGPQGDPLDEGWFMEEERVGFVAADAGSMDSSGSAPAITIEADEPPPSPPTMPVSLMPLRPPAPPRAPAPAPAPAIEPERTVEGARALPDDDAPEIEVTASEPEPDAGASGEFSSGGHTPGFSDGQHPQDTTPVGFSQQLTDVRPRSLGFVKAMARAVDASATIETPTIATPPIAADTGAYADEDDDSDSTAPEIVMVADEPEPEPPKVETSAAAAAPAPAPAPPAAVASPRAAPSPTLPLSSTVVPPVIIQPRKPKLSVAGAVEAVANALEAMAASELQEPTMQIHLSQMEEVHESDVAGDFAGRTSADGAVRALPDHGDPADDVIAPPPPPPPPAPPPLPLPPRDAQKRATTITYEESRPRRASQPPELKMTLRTPTARDKIEDAIASADAMSDPGMKLPPPNAFAPESTVSGLPMPPPPAPAAPVRPPAPSVPSPSPPPPAAFAPEPTVATPPITVETPAAPAPPPPPPPPPPALEPAVVVKPHVSTIPAVPPPPPLPPSAVAPAPAPVAAAEPIAPPAVITEPGAPPPMPPRPPAGVFGPEATVSNAAAAPPPDRSPFAPDATGEHTAFTRFGVAPTADATYREIRAAPPSSAFTPADVDDVAPPPSPTAATREIPLSAVSALTGEDRVRTRDLTAEALAHPPQRPTPERWPIHHTATPTEISPQRSTRTDIVKARLDSRNALLAVSTGEGTRADIVLPFDPIDARSAAILDEIDEHAPANEARDDRTRRRITRLIEKAGDWQHSNELDKSVTAIDLALAEDPNSALAQKLIHRNRDTIMQVFQTFVGDLQRAPILAKPLHELATAPISPRAAFLLSRVDGTMSIDEILDVSGMPRLEAYRYLCQLLLRRILR